ncbi:hypothetical protein PTSG_06421 [Salpingoeca rosetta]|uniref:Rab-GAP TBC domain-containing protein n=1 Tax=Salpingoeca rosetta (strain ATCC 50818 / BSB-021) TaxID=946362 RepID=F2UBZ5_SALR5|nr:uncharacterized protein PTSG_06421 [Salpingoeca rosetta]EGD74410.1 hypothetical protein PTSG_06421 [Salpingoeca rosetta]|eukprot:XP_004993310.1 hypothetical protein PTSG_06421 [Salpingoeca rosetta]
MSNAPVASNELKEVEALLDEDVIDLRALRQFAHGGIPDQPGLRSKVWKLLLGYLPPEKARWEESLAKQREVYQGYLSTYVKSSHDLDDDEDDSDPLGALSSPSSSGSNSSKWDIFFKENEILYQIDMDVKRLTPELAFYQTQTGRPRPIPSPLHLRVQRQVAESATFKADRDGVVAARQKRASTPPPVEPAGDPEAECHWEVIERILFVYAVLNTAIPYVQGMNEILGPLYYVFASDPDPAWREWSEADAFFCFLAIMAHVRDIFDRENDKSDSGVKGVLNRLDGMLLAHIPHVHMALHDMNLDLHFFAFRWIALLLSQEFRLPDVIRLWDSLFASRDILDRLLCLCVAMLQHVSGTLEERDFATCVKLLQNFPRDVDVAIIVEKSNAIEAEVAGNAR